MDFSSRKSYTQRQLGGDGDRKEKPALPLPLHKSHSTTDAKVTYFYCNFPHKLQHTREIQFSTVKISFKI